MEVLLDAEVLHHQLGLVNGTEQPNAGSHQREDDPVDGAQVVPDKSEEQEEKHGEQSSGGGSAGGGDKSGRMVHFWGFELQEFPRAALLSVFLSSGFFCSQFSACLGVVHSFRREFTSCKEIGSGLSQTLI